MTIFEKPLTPSARDAKVPHQLKYRLPPTYTAYPKWPRALEQPDNVRGKAREGNYRRPSAIPPPPPDPALLEALAGTKKKNPYVVCCSDAAARNAAACNCDTCRDTCGGTCP